MDFSYLSNLSNDRPSKDSGKKRQFSSPSKPNPSSKVTSSAVQQFLAKRQQEERQKYEEFKKRKEELLSLRSQNSKSNKKAKLMASRTRDNDFSKIRLTEEEEEAKASREKELERKGLYNKVDRMKARIELEERDSQLPRKRKRKSHPYNNDDPPNVNTVGTSVKVEQKINNGGISQKNEAGKKVLNHRPKPTTVLEYKDLLQVAAKKQFEPLLPPDEDFEDFEEGSDEYEEEDEIHPASTETLPSRNLEKSLKENRTVEKQIDKMGKHRRFEREKPEDKYPHESKQNKENAFINHSHNSKWLHKKSGQRDKNFCDNNQSITLLPQKDSLRSTSDRSALHAKGNQACGTETHSSRKISDSYSSKHNHDKNNYNASRNTSISKHDNDVSKHSDLVQEQRKTSRISSQDRMRSQNPSGQTQSSSLENSCSDVCAQKRKHEETFRNSIKGLPDRRSSGQHTNNSKNEKKVPPSVSGRHLKKDGETTSEFGNTHLDFMGHKKVESSHPFRIPKKNGTKAKSSENDTPSYYTEVSNSFDNVKQPSAHEISFTKESDNPVLKPNKNFLEEKFKKKALGSDKKSKSLPKLNHINEHKHANKTSHHIMNRHMDSKLREKSHSTTTEKNLLNSSDEICNSNEYFTEEGQTRAHRKSTIERDISKNRLKDRSESASSGEVTQYFTEEFTVGKGKEKTGDLKHCGRKKNFSYDKDNSKTKDNHLSAKGHGHSLKATDGVKSHKYEKSKVQESQYFTERFVADEKNTTNTKYDKRAAVLQRENQSKHSQYFTENFATDKNCTENNTKSGYKRSTSLKGEKVNNKQSQYFTESFERKNSESTCKYDKRGTVSRKESQYFTEDFEMAQSGRTKTNERSCKYDERNSLPPKVKKADDEPQYFTENYTNKKTKEGNASIIRSDKRTVGPKKENQMKESHYFTENFTTSETKTGNNFYTSDTEKRTSLLQKEKQRGHSEYFTEKSLMNENRIKRSETNSKHDKRITGSHKEKQTKPAQYYTESYSSDKYHLTKGGRDQNYKHARNSTTAHMEKAKINQSRSKVEEYVPTKIENSVEEYTPGEITSDVEEYIPTKITNKVEEYVPKKIVNKENMPKRASGTSYGTSDSPFEKRNKILRNDPVHSYKYEDVKRNQKRPREQSEGEAHPSKACRYESTVVSNINSSNFKKDKSIANHLAAKSKNSLSHSNTLSEKSKQRHIETKTSKEKVNNRSSSNHIHSSEISNNKHKINQKEKVNSNSHLNGELKNNYGKISRSELPLQKKADGKQLSESQDSMKKFPPSSNNSLLKNSLPPKDRKIIPASSMAQMMNRKFLQGKPFLETASAKNNFETRKSNERKPLKTEAHQTKSDTTPFSKGRADLEKSVPPKLPHKSVASHHQEVNLWSTSVERKADIEHRKKRIEDANRNRVKKSLFNPDRRMKQEEYENKVRNRFSRPSPRMFIKRNMESDDDEEEEEEDDDDMSDFIDDGPIEEDEEDYSRYIREIFGYDKRRYHNEDDFDDHEMETSYAQQMKEERRSARIGYLEDLEDMRKEEEERTIKAEKSKKLKQR